MVTFHALTQWTDPQLYLWRPGNQDSHLDIDISLPRLSQLDEQGLPQFKCELDHQIHEHSYFKLHAGQEWEKEAHNRQMPRLEQYRFPSDVWLMCGNNRVLTANPFTATRDEVFVHLVTARKYRGGKLYLWTPGTPGEFHNPESEDNDGLLFRIPLSGRKRHLFAFAFMDKDGKFEPHYANKLWCARDGQEVWVHSNSAHVATSKPLRKKLAIHFAKVNHAQPLPQAHLWQSDSDFITDIMEQKDVENGRVFTCNIYTGRNYGLKFYWPQARDKDIWESDEANRSIAIDSDTSVWTLGGDHELFPKPPVADRKIVVHVADRAPTCRLGERMTLEVWVNRSPHKLYGGLHPDRDGTWTFTTYPEVVTSFRFGASAITENIARHTIKIPAETTNPSDVHIVLDRENVLARPPVFPLFQDPPFSIERPGVWEQEGELRFALHAPTASAVEIMGEWTGWEQNPLPMQCTTDSAYWWGRVPVAEVGRHSSSHGYHGMMYKYILNNVFNRQDPAAGWVENSAPESASRLLDHKRHQWFSDQWHTPGWEYLIVYEVHPKRFSKRFAPRGLSPLRQLAEEISNSSGYLKKLGVTAIQLMPVNEFAGDESWGYGPAFYYAVESAYCSSADGPDDLKYLVDTCHSNGLAVLLDVVYNHAGTSDNILWSIAAQSFFDGDTDWGAMINFDHPQVVHFFEENLRYLRREYRVDGFRFDHTRTIVDSHMQGWHVTKPGSGHGWEFLHKLRAAIHALDPKCLMIAEHLPNHWPLTNYGGPMDSQWCDNFHDRMVDASRGWHVMSPLADSVKITQTQCDQWYEAVNYPESHDEVGNLNHRIAEVAGYGQGLRRNKVAATATLMSRGIPMWFMGAESGEWRQFHHDGDEALPIDEYLTDGQKRNVRNWWNTLCDLRRGNQKIQGPSPVNVHFAQEEMLAFSRGDGEDFFVVLNFGGREMWRPLSELNLPRYGYKELWNSTWPAFAVESENEHPNGGHHARLTRENWLNIPDYGAVILEKV